MTKQRENCEEKNVQDISKDNRLPVCESRKLTCEIFIPSVKYQILPTLHYLIAIQLE